METANVQQPKETGGKQQRVLWAEQPWTEAALLPIVSVTQGRVAVAFVLRFTGEHHDRWHTVKTAHGFAWMLCYVNLLFTLYGMTGLEVMFIQQQAVVDNSDNWV